MNSKQRCLSRIKVALIVSFLAPLLTSCAADPVISQTIEVQRVPAALLVPCPVPVLEGGSYQAAIELALALQGGIAECNRRLEDIRAWSAK
jgi:hypothetical protein